MTEATGRGCTWGPGGGVFLISTASDRGVPGLLALGVIFVEVAGELLDSMSSLIFTVLFLHKQETEKKTKPF